jgi:uncharacterized protein
MTPVVLLDTNVVLELFHWHDARSAPILAAARDGRISLVTDQRCLDELLHVLGRPPFAYCEPVAEALGMDYRALAEIAEPAGPSDPAPALPRCRDPDDQKFLELAVRAGAELLVTRDKALLTLARSKFALVGLRILRPEDAIALLGLPPNEPVPRSGDRA